MNTIQIPVYDDYTIELNKYPRKNTNKGNTDVVMIEFLMHQEYLKKLANTYYDAIKYYNECKEFFYIFKTINGKENKKYSAQEIIFLINNINTNINGKNNFEQQQKYLRKFDYLDQLFYLYIKNKDFYLNLYQSIQDAKIAYFQRREINYKFYIPFDFYGSVKISGQVYTAIELLEINAYVSFLLKNRIIKELPDPVKIREEELRKEELIRERIKQRNTENSQFLKENKNNIKEIENENIYENDEKIDNQDPEIKIIYFK